MKSKTVTISMEDYKALHEVFDLACGFALMFFTEEAVTRIQNARRTGMAPEAIRDALLKKQKTAEQQQRKGERR